MNERKNQNKSCRRQAPVIVWLRQDLRLCDQPALYQASKSGAPVLPIFIWAPEEETPWVIGAASRVWLHFSLKALEKAFAKIDSRLLVFDASKHPSGSLALLSTLAQLTGADTVLWNRRYEPAVSRRDTQIKSHLEGLGLTVETFKGALLIEPWEVLTKQEKPFQVFTPFWQACRTAMQTNLCPRAPLPAPAKLPFPDQLESKLLNSQNPLLQPVDIDDLRLLPEPEPDPEKTWHKSIVQSCSPGEAGALSQLEKFVGEALADYPAGRDQPARAGVSRLSAHLHFGELSPHTVWHTVIEKATTGRSSAQLKEATQSFLRELGWREFAHHILYHFPHTAESELRPAFRRFPWGNDAEALKAWSKGRTGYPIVDAGMRELWQTGIMHNRVRMIAASFLVKDLLVPWQEGARWFWQTLVDADLAQNSLGWQWTAGCGADAAPYFRIFNPVLQGEKFDPDGAYVRRYVPELAAMPAKWIHKPWLAPPAVLASAAVRLGENYPAPIVDHASARQRALAAFKELQKGDWQPILEDGRKT